MNQLFMAANGFFFVSMNKILATYYETYGQRENRTIVLLADP